MPFPDRSAANAPEALIATIAADFTAGRFQWLTVGYLYPLPIYLDGGLMVATDSVEAEAFFQSLLAFLQSDGLGRVEGHLSPVEQPLNNRFQMQTTWIWRGHLGSVPLMQTNCFNRGSWASHSTEMVQITMQHKKAGVTLEDGRLRPLSDRAAFGRARHYV